MKWALAFAIWMAARDFDPTGAEFGLKKPNPSRVVVVWRKEQCNRLGLKLYHRYGEIGGHSHGCLRSAAAAPSAEFEAHTVRALKFLRSIALRDRHGGARLSLPCGFCRRERFRMDT